MINQKHLAILAIIWVASVVGMYYAGHKPIEPDLAINLAISLWQIVVALAVLSVAGGVGARLISIAGVYPLARVALQGAFGLGLLSTAILVVGVTIGSSQWILGLALIGAGVFVHREILRWWRSWQDLFCVWSAGGRLGYLIGSGVMFVLFLNLFTALAPPLKYDALVYHLALPQAYLEAGRITYLPWVMFWGMPQLTEMLYVWAMVLADVQAAVIFGWMVGILALAGLLGYVTQRLGARAAWISIASLLSGFTLTSSLSWGYVGWMTVLLGLCVLVSLDLWCFQGGWRYLVLAGCFAGFALGAKYTAGVILLGGLAIVWVRHRREGIAGRGKASPVWVNMLLFGGVAIIASLPWWIKNTLATGHPFSPLLFPVGTMDGSRLKLLYQNQVAWGDWRNAVFLPWQATISGFEDGPGFGASIGPLFLALGVFFGLGWRARPSRQHIALENAAIVSLVGLVIWAIMGRLAGLLIQSRLYLSIFPALAMLAGMGFVNLTNIQWPGVRLGRVAGVLVMLVFGFNLLQLGVYTVRQGAIQVLLGLWSPETYLARNLGMYALAMQGIDELPEDARVLMLWEPRSFYCAPRCLPDEILDRWLTDRNRYHTPEAILRSWRQAGFTHVLFRRSGADFFRQDDRYQPSDWETLDDLFAELPIHTDLNQVYTLYSLTP